MLAPYDHIVVIRRYYSTIKKDMGSCNKPSDLLGVPQSVNQSISNLTSQSLTHLLAPCKSEIVSQKTGINVLKLPSPIKSSHSKLELQKRVRNSRI